MGTNKVSIRFYNDREVRAVWDEPGSKWMFSVLDVVGVLNEQEDYQKNRNYWKYLKAKLLKESPELVSGTTQLKLTAADGKKYNSDVLDFDGIVALAKVFPNAKANKFLEWFTYSDETIDGKSKQKAYSLFDSSFIDSIEVGTTKGLQQIHSYLFGGLYEFAGQIRTKTISKGGFTFCVAQYLPDALATIDRMPQDSFGQIVDKYVEMNVAHPFMEGNGRSTRVWLDLILKAKLGKCIDWSRIDKKAYLAAMETSPSYSGPITSLLESALTDKVSDREIFMKGIDYSYYYEQVWAQLSKPVKAVKVTSGASQASALKAINRMHTMRNWLIGYYIVEFEQKGKERAQYGEKLLKRLEEAVNAKGLTLTLFKWSRVFYRLYPQMAALFVSGAPTPNRIGASVMHHFVSSPEAIVSSLSFTHLREIMSIDDPLVRYFYEQECMRCTWSVRELRRQIGTNLPQKEAFQGIIT